MAFANEAYLESEVLSADPLELVRILYRGASEAVTAARDALRAGDIRARSRAISKAHDIVSELALAVSHDTDPQLSRNLVELYAYMQQRLHEANFCQTDPPLAEVAQLLYTLSEAWRHCPSSPAPSPQPAYHPVPVEHTEDYAPLSCTF